ncbi:MAG TPA: SRPBCC family protein [Acidimicrobiales bacterium]|nr:SRPBCC family protein [Acidimicrobiales bacterium]
MINLVEVTTTSTAGPDAFFDCWADMATWHEWNLDTEWARLDGPFATGSTGVLKPKGGPKTKFRIESIVPRREFVDVSLLLGAKLTFDHQVRELPDGGTSLTIKATLSGLLAPVWKLILGKGIAKTLAPDTARLVARVEGAATQRTGSAG